MGTAFSPSALLLLEQCIHASIFFFGLQCCQAVPGVNSLHAHNQVAQASTVISSW